MSNPLAHYFNRFPTPQELATVTTDELARIIDAAKAAERLNLDDLSETREWARAVRAIAERALRERAHD